VVFAGLFDAVAHLGGAAALEFSSCRPTNAMNDGGLSIRGQGGCCIWCRPNERRLLSSCPAAGRKSSELARGTDARPVSGRNIRKAVSPPASRSPQMNWHWLACNQMYRAAFAAGSRLRYRKSLGTKMSETAELFCLHDKTHNPAWRPSLATRYRPAGGPAEHPVKTLFMPGTCA